MSIVNLSSRIRYSCSCITDVDFRWLWIIFANVFFDSLVLDNTKQTANENFWSQCVCISLLVELVAPTLAPTAKK